MWSRLAQAVKRARPDLFGPRSSDKTARRLLRSRAYRKNGWGANLLSVVLDIRGGVTIRGVIRSAGGRGWGDAVRYNFPQLVEGAADPLVRAQGWCHQRTST